MSESFPAHARKVSSWLLGWLIHALKKLHSPRACARTFASPYTGSKLRPGRSAYMRMLKDGRRVPLVVLDETDDLVLRSQLDKFQVVVKELHGGLRHQDVHAAFNRVFRNVIVSVYIGLSSAAHADSSRQAYCQE